MSNYPELKKGLLTFRELFIRGILHKSVVNGSAQFLYEMRNKQSWTEQEALKVYGIIRPYRTQLLSLGFNISVIPMIKKPKAFSQVKNSSRLIKERLIGYDKEGFVIYFPYDKLIFRAIQYIPESRYNKDKGYWQAPLSQLTAVKKFAETYNFKYTDKGRAMVNNISENLEASYRFDNIELDLPMKLKPYPFQYSGIDYSIKNKSVIIADEMGLGKTPEAIGTILGTDSFPCIVICPKSLRLNWQNEWHKFSDKKAIILTKENVKQFGRYFEHGLAHVAITNYEGARTIFTREINETRIKTGPNAGKIMQRVKMHGYEKIFKSVILDEAHEVRNNKTIRFKTIKPLMNGPEIRLALTGSPIVKSTSDLASILELIGRIEDFGGRYKFIRKYNKFKKNDYYKKEMPTNLKELNIKLRSLCFIRREKHQVAKDLPDKIRQIIKVDIDNRRDYDKAVNTFRSWMQENNYTPDRINSAMRAEILVKIGLLKQISAKGKLGAFSEFLDEVYNSGEKVVVFCWYKNTANFIKDNFKDVLLITGDVSDDEVERNKKLFQDEKSKYRIIVVTYRRGGVGHTLTAASKVAFIELGWTYKDQSQAEDRLHRIGAKNTVNAYYFIGENTIDEDIYEIIEQRRQMEKDATGGTTEIETKIGKRIANKILENDNN
ncbi:MAG: DEAD/DEAH box helicase [Bacteroidota bacterium]